MLEMEEYNWLPFVDVLVKKNWMAWLSL
jgi:hypothetical protein